MILGQVRPSHTHTTHFDFCKHLRNCAYGSVEHLMMDLALCEHFNTLKFDKASFSRTDIEHRMMSCEKHIFTLQNKIDTQQK